MSKKNKQVSLQTLGKAPPCRLHRQGQFNLLKILSFLLILKTENLFLLSTYLLLVKHWLESWNARKLGSSKIFELSDTPASWPHSLQAFQPYSLPASKPGCPTGNLYEKARS
jgi:hypothetical protein